MRLPWGLAVLRTRVFEERRQFETVAQFASFLFSPALPPEALLHWVQGRARALAATNAF